MKLQRILVMFSLVLLTVAMVGCATKQTAMLSDQEIANNIKSHLESPAGPEGPFVIDIIVDKGVVKLDGKVGDFQAKDEAGDVAQQQQGVQEVKNFLIVK
jgi:osmotically-inducible protein OsmY